jgi:hypothetical protein
VVRRSDRPDGQGDQPGTAPSGKRRDSARVLDATGAALSVLAVAGLCVAALLLRPSGSAPVRGRGPLGHQSPVVILGALACGAVLLPVCRRLRERFGDGHAELSARQRLADAARWALTAVAPAACVLVLVLHRFNSNRENPKPVRSRPVTVLPFSTERPRPAPHGHAPGWIGTVLTGVSVLAALAVLAVIVFAAWVLLRSLSRRRAAPAGGDDFTALDGEQERLAEAVDSGRRALLDGADARAAVIACYAAMEESLAASGVARHRSDSPQDLLERAVGTGLTAAAAATALTDLFREARYSTHPMDDSHRRRAAEALADIAAGLSAHTGLSAHASHDPHAAHVPAGAPSQGARP